MISIAMRWYSAYSQGDSAFFSAAGLGGKTLLEARYFGVETGEFCRLAGGYIATWLE